MSLSRLCPAILNQPAGGSSSSSRLTCSAAARFDWPRKGDMGADPLFPSDPAPAKHQKPGANAASPIQTPFRNF